jgi:hypothetical protein
MQTDGRAGGHETNWRFSQLMRMCIQKQIFLDLLKTTGFSSTTLLHGVSYYLITTRKKLPKYVCWEWHIHSASKEHSVYFIKHRTSDDKTSVQLCTSVSTQLCQGHVKLNSDCFQFSNTQYWNRTSTQHLIMALTGTHRSDSTFMILNAAVPFNVTKTIKIIS